jgi:hypothetical protein
MGQKLLVMLKVQEAPSKCPIIDFVELIRSCTYSNRTMNVFVE